MTPMEPVPSFAPVEDAVGVRKSVRAFTSRPVDRSLLERLLAVASRAPSGANTQPWKVYVLQGAARDGLVETVCAAHDVLAADPARMMQQFKQAYDYYPKEWFDPYLQRRRDNGLGLYRVLGIGKDDTSAMHRQHQRNFRFFDAPVGLMFTVDRRMGTGALLDMGMFMQNIMVLARAHGLATCPQAAWIGFSDLVLRHLGSDDKEMLVCGMAVGYADECAPVNTYEAPRESVDNFTVWLDGDRVER